MKSSHSLTTISFAALLACAGTLACGGAEVAQNEQGQSLNEQGQSLTADQAPAGAPAPEAMRPGHAHGPGADGRRHGPPSPEKMIERFDANGNGLLEASELPERMQEHVGDIDKSGDGVVTKDELAAHMKERFAEHAKKRFERKDTNKDGMLDEGELGKRWAHMSVADQNADKKLTAEELRAAFEAGKLAPMREHGKRDKRAKAPPAPLE